MVVSPHDRGAWAVTSQLWLVWPGGGQGWRVSLGSRRCRQGLGMMAYPIALVGPGEPDTRSLTSHHATMPRPWSLQSRRSIAAICGSVVLPAGSACWFAYGRPALAVCRMCPIRPLCPVMRPLLMR